MINAKPVNYKMSVYIVSSYLNNENIDVIIYTAYKGYADLIHFKGENYSFKWTKSIEKIMLHSICEGLCLEVLALELNNFSSRDHFEWATFFSNNASITNFDRLLNDHFAEYYESLTVAEKSLINLRLEGARSDEIVAILNISLNHYLHLLVSAKKKYIRFLRAL